MVFFAVKIQAKDGKNKNSISHSCFGTIASYAIPLRSARKPQDRNLGGMERYIVDCSQGEFPSTASASNSPFPLLSSYQDARIYGK